MGAMLLGVLFSLAAPWPLALLVDSALGDKPPPPAIEAVFGTSPMVLVVVAAVAGLLISLLTNLLNVWDEYVNTNLSQRMILDFRSELFAHAQRLSQAFHDGSHTGVFIARVNLEAQNIGEITVSMPPLVQSVLTLGGMFFISFRLAPGLALLSLAVVPFIYVSTGYYAKKIEPRLYEVRNAEGKSLSIVHEAMSMLRVIVAFGRQDHELRRFRTQAQRTVDARVAVTVRQTVFSLVVDAITATGYALVLGFGAVKVIHGSLSVGQLLVIVAYIQAVYRPLQQISGTLATLQNLFVGLEGAFDLLDAEPDVHDRFGAVEIGRARGAVEFRNVGFAYQGRRDTLRDISFRVRAGARVAIVGPTGAGKTTLMNLLIRYYDPREGQILLDGQDTSDLTLTTLRHNIAVVHQDPLLFQGSIIENIRYGRLDATDEEVRAAARAANIDDFIAALPAGYDTRLAERGGRLSGGERQRVTIARAFLKNAPILILDEPTSAVDARTENMILDALDRLMAGRTTFLIAHRLSTIRDVDGVLVMNAGRLVEAGTHDELFARAGGLYRQLWDMQTGSRRATPTPVSGGN
jgi:ABC-type multidrug transport system fused ATPase/permease subunit